MAELGWRRGTHGKGGYIGKIRLFTVKLSLTQRGSFKLVTTLPTGLKDTTWPTEEEAKAEAERVFVQFMEYINRHREGT